MATWVATSKTFMNGRLYDLAARIEWPTQPGSNWALLHSPDAQAAEALAAGPVTVGVPGQVVSGEFLRNSSLADARASKQPAPNLACSDKPADSVPRVPSVVRPRGGSAESL